jgi:anaerobic ribonucleoside-triphosphate reductase
MTSDSSKKRKIPQFKEDVSLKDLGIEPSCSYCGSEYVFGMSRIVGYFSVIESWNKSKQAELKQRQKGNYWPDEEI